MNPMHPSILDGWLCSGTHPRSYRCRGNDGHSASHTSCSYADGGMEIQTTMVKASAPEAGKSNRNSRVFRLDHPTCCSASCDQGELGNISHTNSANSDPSLRVGECLSEGFPAFPRDLRLSLLQLQKHCPQQRSEQSPRISALISPISVCSSPEHGKHKDTSVKSKV